MTLPTHPAPSCTILTLNIPTSHHTKQSLPFHCHFTCAVYHPRTCIQPATEYRTIVAYLPVPQVGTASERRTAHEHTRQATERQAQIDDRLRCMMQTNQQGQRHLMTSRRTKGAKGQRRPDDIDREGQRVQKGNAGQRRPDDVANEGQAMTSIAKDKERVQKGNDETT